MKASMRSRNRSPPTLPSKNCEVPWGVTVATRSLSFFVGDSYNMCIYIYNICLYIYICYPLPESLPIFVVWGVNMYNIFMYIYKPSFATIASLGPGGLTIASQEKKNPPKYPHGP